MTEPRDEARDVLREAISDAWHSPDMADECWIDYERVMQTLAARGYHLVSEPAPDVEAVDVERLARAVQNADHGASFRTRQGAIVQWQYLSDQQKALALGDAEAIAAEYAALHPADPSRREP